MDRAEAIKVLKKTSDGIGHDEYGIYFTDKWVQAYEMAIAALREQEQRERGCASCNGGFGDNTVEFRENHYNFCPVCGRKLGGAEE